MMKVFRSTYYQGMTFILVVWTGGAIFLPCAIWDMDVVFLQQLCHMVNGFHAWDIFLDSIPSCNMYIWFYFHLLSFCLGGFEPPSLDLGFSDFLFSSCLKFFAFCFPLEAFKTPMAKDWSLALMVPIWTILYCSWAGIILRNHTYLKVYKCWQILPILKMPTMKSLAIFFKKYFNFQGFYIIYIINWQFLGWKKFTPSKLGETGLQKLQNGESFFWRKPPKNSPWAKFCP